MKFREHRGGLAESMETMQEFDDPYLLLLYLKKKFPYVGNYEANPYGGTDERIGWTDVHIVTGIWPREGRVVIGFTDGPII